MHAPEALVLDLLEWVAEKPRPYRELMATWRTSCPRLPVWEDAVDRGFVHRASDERHESLVLLTAAGKAWLQTHRRQK
jgi:hypothetical protein